MREIVFDTETTGLDPKTGDRMVEIGCIEMVNLVPTGASYHAYFNPERDMPSGAEAVHGLSAAFLSDKPLFRHLAATLVQQAHLAPLPIAQLPVYWEHDHALRLYPAPHCVVLGDRTEQQALAKFEDTELVNPGCFADDGSFAVYRPATREVEFSAV